MSLRPRVLCTTSSFPRWPGDSTTPFVRDLADDLGDAGYDVGVLAPHTPEAATKERMGDIDVERFRYLWPTSLQTVCYQGGALINLRKHPLNVLKLPALVAAEWAAVNRRLGSGQYDLLHSHWTLPQGFVGSVAAPRWNIPHVVTVHGGDVFALRGVALERFKRFALRRADAITVNSSATERAVMAIDPGSTPVHRIPMGVSPRVPGKQDRKVQAIRRRYKRGRGPFLIFAGRLVSEKGVSDLLAAVSLLRQRFDDITLAVVGEGQDSGAFQRLAEQLGLGGHVFFTGWMQPEDIPYAFTAADISLSPSRRSKSGWVEAQGLTILEAMATTTPVVATRVGGIVDSIEDGVNGLLVEERAPAQIAEAVSRLVNEPEFASHIGLAARKTVIERFSREACAKAFSRLFADLLSERQQRY